MIFGNLLTSVIVSSIENIAGLMGVDVTDADQTNEKLADIKASLSDPENLEHMEIIISSSAEVAGVAIKALKPYIRELISTIIESLQGFSQNMVQAAVQTVISSMQAVPIIGAVLSFGQTGITVFETWLSLVNTVSSITTSTSDIANAVLVNTKKIMKEKEQL